MNDQLKNIITTLISCASFLGVVWFIVQGSIDNYITEKAKEYVESDSYKYKEQIRYKIYSNSAEFEKILDAYFESSFDNNSESTTNVLTFTKIMSIKLGIPEEQVVNELAIVVNNLDEDSIFRERLKNVLRLLNELYPEKNVWRTDLN